MNQRFIQAMNTVLGQGTAATRFSFNSKRLPTLNRINFEWKSVTVTILQRCPSLYDELIAICNAILTFIHRCSTMNTIPLRMLLVSQSLRRLPSAAVHTNAHSPLPNTCISYILLHRLPGSFR